MAKGILLLFSPLAHFLMSCLANSEGVANFRDFIFELKFYEV